MDRFITTTEAAAREGVSVQAIRKRIERGSMAGVKVGNSWMVPATGWEPVTVTVTGPTGCGKTRLAGAIAALWEEQGGTVHSTDRGVGYERLILSRNVNLVADELAWEKGHRAGTMAAARLDVQPEPLNCEVSIGDASEGKGRLAETDDLPSGFKRIGAAPVIGTVGSYAEPERMYAGFVDSAPRIVNLGA